MIYALLDIKMDRPIDKNKHYISPGGYEIKFRDNTTMQFDFCDYEGLIDDKDPSILHCKLTHADLDSFPNMINLCNSLSKTTELIECYVYTGEENEPEINLTKILSFIIVDNNYYKNKYVSTTSTEFISITINDNIAEFAFTKKLLDSYKIP